MKKKREKKEKKHNKKMRAARSPDRRSILHPRKMQTRSESRAIQIGGIPRIIRGLTILDPCVPPLKILLAGMAQLQSTLACHFTTKPIEKMLAGELAGIGQTTRIVVGALLLYAMMIELGIKWFIERTPGLSQQEKLYWHRNAPTVTSFLRSWVGRLLKHQKEAWVAGYHRERHEQKIPHEAYFEGDHFLPHCIKHFQEE